MLVGHYAIAMAAKAIDPKPSLCLLFVATQFVDLVWLLLLPSGLESISAKLPSASAGADILKYEHQAFSHGLVASFFWAAVFGVLIYFSRLCNRNLARAVLLALVVFSHWWLDLLVHAADLPIAFDDGVKVGAHLWSHPDLAFWLEFTLVLIGFALFLWRTSNKPISSQAQDWVEQRAAWWPWLLLLCLLGVHYLSSSFWPVVSVLPASLSDWITDHPLGVLTTLLAFTWLGLPVLVALTIDRVRGAKL